MLNISEKTSMTDARLCSEYASEFKQSMGWRGTNIPNTIEKPTKNQSLTGWYVCGKRGAMGKNVECLCCHEVEAVEYFTLLGMRYGYMNAVTQSLKLRVK